MYILLSEVHLEEEEEYKNYLRITSECFDELFVIGRDNNIKEITNIRDGSSSKLKLAEKMFHNYSFGVLF